MSLQRGITFLAVAVLLLALAPAAFAQGASTDDRVRRLEREVEQLKAEVAAMKGGTKGQEQGTDRVAELERKLEVLASEIETLKLGEAAATADRSTNGMGPAASKVYRGGNGLAVGGYGEVVYRDYDGRLQDGSRSSAADTADLQRAVLYFGYKFNDRFLFNSEVEFEHAVTASDKGGETEMEFAYADYLWKPQANVRAGLLAGGSAFTGDSGQGLLDDRGQRIGGRVTLYEGHVDWRWRGLQVRALGVRSRVGDTAAINHALGLEGMAGIGKAQSGAYGEIGYDLLSLRPGSRQRFIPFARYERYDTQSEVAAGFERNPANDVHALTLGFNYYPIDQLVLKANILRVRNQARTGQNEFQIGLGYVF